MKPSQAPSTNAVADELEAACHQLIERLLNADRCSIETTRNRLELAVREHRRGQLSHRERDLASLVAGMLNRALRALMSAPSSQSILQRTVTVCNACLCASCWQGRFYCEEAKSAGTSERTVEQLLDGNVRESLEHWFRDPHTGRVNEADADACRAAIAARRTAQS